MSPDEARELFSAAYDGELESEQQAAFQSLLDEDAELAEEYAQFRAILDEAHDEAAFEDDLDAELPDLLVGVQDKIRKRSRGRYYRDEFSRTSGQRALLPMVLAAVMLVVLAAAWLALNYVEIQAPAGGSSGAETTSTDPG